MCDYRQLGMIRHIIDYYAFNIVINAISALQQKFQ